MAHFFNVQITDELDQLADVDFSVGANGHNKMGDVQLVQTLLKPIIESLASDGDFAFRDRRGNAIMSIDVDGICGPITRDAILAYQVKKFSAQQGTNLQIRVDGLIDSLSRGSGRGRSTVSKTIYTIAFLNDDFKFFTGRPLEAGDVTLEPLRSQLEATSNFGTRVPDA